MTYSAVFLFSFAAAIHLASMSCFGDADPSVADLKKLLHQPEYKTWAAASEELVRIVESSSDKSAVQEAHSALEEFDRLAVAWLISAYPNDDPIVTN